jgi:hypothetical protein
MVTGENAGTWGDKTNDNLNVIQQAIAGYGEQSIAGGAQTTALTIANSPTLSVARNIVIKLTGTITGNQIVTVPEGIEKTWIISNGTTGAFQVQFKTTAFGSTGTIWSTTDKGIKILYSNGTEIFSVDLSTLSGTVASASIADLAVTSGKLASFAVTSARLASFAVTTTRLATNAVTAIKIAQSTITQSKLATGSVGADQLIATAVTPGTYTAATVTVDADGRITGASSGAAATRTGFEVKQITAGPASGTYTANANALRIVAYMVGGGGGGNGLNNGGGQGGKGIYYKTITQPFSQPYSVGGSGTGNPGSSNSGGATNIANVGTTNGGGGASNNADGNAGSAPGASFDITNSPIKAAYVGNSAPGGSVWTGGEGALQIWENINT